MNTKKIRESLEKLRRHHRECEDTWYACPKAVDACSNPGEGTECNCWADEDNAILDEVLAELEGPIEIMPGDKAVFDDAGQVTAVFRAAPTLAEEDRDFLLRAASFSPCRHTVGDLKGMPVAGSSLLDGEPCGTCGGTRRVYLVAPGQRFPTMLPCPECLPK